jgi:hypothetical protein
MATIVQTDTRWSDDYDLQIHFLEGADVRKRQLPACSAGRP